MINILTWFFGLGWWSIFKSVASIGAPLVCVVGIIWYIYDRITGGI